MPTRHKGTLEEIQALDVYIKLQRAAETVMRRTTAHLADYDLPVSQFAVLEALYHLGVLSQRELANKLLQSTGQYLYRAEEIGKKKVDHSRTRSG